MRFFCAIVLVALHAPATLAETVEVHQSVEALWSDFDPRQDPLDVRVVREWEDDGVVFRYVTYHIGTFKGRPARMAAFYAFPQGGRKLPALLHIHISTVAGSGRSWRTSPFTPSGVTPVFR